MKGKLCPGIEAVLDLVKFDEKLTDCDLVLTGEGRFDSQSIRGKVISGVSKRAREKNVPVVVVAGSVDKEMESVSATRPPASPLCFPLTVRPWITRNPSPSAGSIINIRWKTFCGRCARRSISGKSPRGG